MTSTHDPYTVVVRPPRDHRAFRDAYPALTEQFRGAPLPPGELPTTAPRSVLAFAYAHASQAPVAMGTLVIEPKARGFLGHIEDVFVAPAHRGKGVGRFIVSSLLEEARASGCFRVALLARPGSEGFYDALGFTQCVGFFKDLT